MTRDLRPLSTDRPVHLLLVNICEAARDGTLRARGDNPPMWNEHELPPLPHEGRNTWDFRPNGAIIHAADGPEQSPAVTTAWLRWIVALAETFEYTVNGDALVDGVALHVGNNTVFPMITAPELGSLIRSKTALMASMERAHGEAVREIIPGLAQYVLEKVIAPKDHENVSGHPAATTYRFLYKCLLTLSDLGEIAPMSDILEDVFAAARGRVLSDGTISSAWKSIHMGHNAYMVSDVETTDSVLMTLEWRTAQERLLLAIHDKVPGTLAVLGWKSIPGQPDTWLAPGPDGKYFLRIRPEVPTACLLMTNEFCDPKHIYLRSNETLHVAENPICIDNEDGEYTFIGRGFPYPGSVPANVWDGRKMLYHPGDLEVDREQARNATVLCAEVLGELASLYFEISAAIGRVDDFKPVPQMPRYLNYCGE